jgi:hypothetical protein
MDAAKFSEIPAQTLAPATFGSFDVLFYVQHQKAPGGH